MEWIGELWRRLAFFFRRGQFHRDLEEEISEHLRMKASALNKDGTPSDEARNTAMREFGNALLLRERSRDAWGFAWLETFLQDLRYGLRQLRRNPGFTAVAVITLALGIGANTAIFSLVDAVLLSTLPVKNPQQLVLPKWDANRWPPRVSQSGIDPSVSFSYPLFERFRAEKHVFSSVFAFVPLGTSDQNTTIAFHGQPALAGGEMVTGEFFSGLGIHPYSGRVLNEQDEAPGAPGVAVISFRYWSRQFARSRSIVGQGIMLDGFPYTIVGVMPPDFTGVIPGSEPDIWVPFAAKPGIGPWGNSPSQKQTVFNQHYWFCLQVMARLRPGVARGEARAAAETVFQNFLIEGQNPPPKLQSLPRLDLAPASAGLDLLTGYMEHPLLILMAAVGLVLLIACANVAALLVARATSRRKEVGIRLALGASRRRLIRQLLTESVLLAVIGAALGLVFASWGARALLRLASTGVFAITLDLHLDLTVLAFTAVGAVATGILFGIAPALSSTRVNLTSAFRERAGTISLGPRGPRLGLGKALVISQVALSLLLLIGTGLFVRTLDNLENENLGFNQHKLLLFGIDPTQDGYKGERLVNLYNRLLRRIQVLPGVRSATIWEFAPFSGWSDNHSDFSVAGYSLKTNDKMVRSGWCGPGFFRTMGIPILLGRGIRWSDTAHSPKIAVVSAALARHFFGSADPVGRRFNFGNSADRKGAFEIVGIVRDAELTNLQGNPGWDRREVYLPFAQAPNDMGKMYFEVRTFGEPTGLVPDVRRTVRELDPRLPLAGVKTQVDQTDESLALQKLFALLSGFFGALALLLASIGLYGTMSYTVTRRTSEIGIRMALGAQRPQVLWMVLRDAMVLIGVGIAIGLPLALAVVRLISSQLYGVKPSNPATIALASLILAGVATAAGYLPARRATKVDPMVALRHE